MNPDRYGRAMREIRRSWEEVRLLQSAVWRGGNHIGQLVWDYEAVEEGARPRTTPVIGIERSTWGFCWRLPWRQRKAISTENVGQGPGEHCLCSEGSLGKEQVNCRKAGQANDVCIGSPKDCSSTTCEVGKSPG